MKKISIGKFVKGSLVSLGLVAIALASFSILTHPGNAASASESPCLANGVVNNSPDGNGVVFTVTTKGTCQDAPLVLTSVDSNGIKTVLASLPLIPDEKGAKVASVSIVPSKSVASYAVNVENAFSATINP